MSYAGYNVTAHCLVLLLLYILAVYAKTVVKDKEYWYEEARSTIKKKLQNAEQVAHPHAKNVILFVGDGMSISTVTAARILRGQRQGKPGEEHQLAWDTFPSIGLAKTYNSNAQIGESSACATALLCGVKANYETVGLDSQAQFENCHSSFYSRAESLIDWAQQQGKATGIVTTTRITHATPAALYAHSPSRYWEDDGKMPPASRKVCKDIARQLVEDEPGRNINVILGGGRRHWLPKGSQDPEEITEEGRRLDGKNLIDDWIRDKKRRGMKAEYVWNRGQMEKVNSRDVDHLLGLFSYSHMEFEADRNRTPDGDPSLADMTRTALQILLKNPRGFFLFVEGGRIDHAHHYNNAFRALDETLGMEAALLTALPMINPSETLIVVTADHSHVMTFGGLGTAKGNPVLGIDAKVSDIDGFPYSTILYGNGPGHTQPRNIPSNYTTEMEEKNSVHSSAVPRQWGTHSGEDVPVYAQGPLSLVLFSGVFDQTYIPHAVAYIACLGEFSGRCSEEHEHVSNSNRSCGTPEMSSFSSPEEVVAVASSVMADDSKTAPRLKGGKSCALSSHSKSYEITIVIVGCVKLLW